MTSLLPPLSTMLSSLAPSQHLNNTVLSMITPTALHSPFYHVTRPSILSFMSDKYLSLAAPILIYWALSLVFHALDAAKLPYFEARRIHESPEVLARNKATIRQVVRAVFVQQLVQTLLGLVWLEDEETILRREVYRDHLGEMAALATRVADAVLILLGRRSGEELLRHHGEALVRWTYWWGIPAFQLFLAL
jgi:sphinganine C4-monooxygenase